MRHPHRPPVQIDCRGMAAQWAAEFTASAQKKSDDDYKGVEWEVVTEKTKFGMAHICKHYVDGNLVERGLAGLSDAMYSPTRNGQALK